MGIFTDTGSGGLVAGWILTFSQMCAIMELWSVYHSCILKGDDELEKTDGLDGTLAGKHF